MAARDCAKNASRRRKIVRLGDGADRQRKHFDLGFEVCGLVEDFGGIDKHFGEVESLEEHLCRLVEPVDRGLDEVGREIGQLARGERSALMLGCDAGAFGARHSLPRPLAPDRQPFHRATLFGSTYRRVWKIALRSKSAALASGRHFGLGARSVLLERKTLKIGAVCAVNTPGPFDLRVRTGLTFPRVLLRSVDGFRPGGSGGVRSRSHTSRPPRLLCRIGPGGGRRGPMAMVFSGRSNGFPCGPLLKATGQSPLRQGWRRSRVPHGPRCDNAVRERRRGAVRPAAVGGDAQRAEWSRCISGA